MVLITLLHQLEKHFTLLARCYLILLFFKGSNVTF